MVFPFPSHESRPREIREKCLPARAARLASLEELEERAEIEEQLLEPGKWEHAWRQQCEKERANTFWEKIELIPKSAYDELLIYLYRLEPKVFNRPGEPAYLCKYQLPLTEEQVQEDWGGGRYEIYCKRGRRTIAGKNIFTIMGRPTKYKEGQTDATGKALTSSGGNGQPSGGNGSSDLAETLKALMPILKPEGGAKAAEAAVEVVRTGYTSVLDAQQKAASAPNELLTKLAERALMPQQPQGPGTLEIIDKLVSVAGKLNGGPRENPNTIENLDNQLGLIQKLTGKTISDLLNAPEGKAPKMDPLVQLGISIASILPGLLREFRQFKHEERQWQAYMASKGLTPPPAVPPPPTADVQPPPAPPNLENPAAPPPGPMPTQEQMMQGLIAEIIGYFQQGWDGYACATSLAVHYGEALQMLAPILSDRGEMDKLIQQIPALKALETEPRKEGQPSWPEFVEEFFRTLNPEPEDEEEDNFNESIPVAVSSRKRKKAVEVN
jgi:hypothetical protein